MGLLLVLSQCSVVPVSQTNHAHCPHSRLSGCCCIGDAIHVLPSPQAPYIADQEASADTAYGAAPVGRVKIQTYRGPSKGDYDFAPWGYYNTQPADLALHH